METITIREVIGLVDVYLDPITLDVRQAVQLATFVILCCIISVFGIGANILNIFVFVKQGFKDSINISLLGLAVSDLACSVSMFWTSICFNPLFHSAGFPIVYPDVMFLTAAWPHVCFNRVTSFITAFITLERCLCIAMPLKVKTIITPFRTKVIIVTIYIFTILLFVPFYFVNKLKWTFVASQNRSILGITFAKHREIVDGVTFFLHSVFLSSSCLICVAICTIILVVKLNKKTKWRKASVAQTASNQEGTSVKEKKVIKMITLISTIFIICYIPPTANFLTMVFCTDFNFSGRLENLLFVIWAFAFLMQAINSSVNIFVYFTMSSKFRETLYVIFAVFTKK